MNKSPINRELEIKEMHMREYEPIYKVVEDAVKLHAGEDSIKKYHELQKKIKKDCKLRTSRVDWRTKVGIILWFCKNWNIIQPCLMPGQSNSEEDDEAVNDNDLWNASDESLADFEGTFDTFGDNE